MEIGFWGTYLYFIILIFSFLGFGILENAIYKESIKNSN